MIDGAYWLREPGPNSEVVLAYQGVVASEAIAAAGLAAQNRRDIGVLAVTSADRLNAGWQAAQRARSRGQDAVSHIERLLAPLPRHCALITAIDGHPATLSWLGAVHGHRTAGLGVEHFGQTGTVRRPLPPLRNRPAEHPRDDRDAVAGASAARRGPGMKRFWADYTTYDFARMGRPNMIAVLPVAAIEQHGPHLPLSVDRDILEGLIAAALPLMPPDLPVVFLPTQAVGKSNEHARYPGTLTISAETLIAAWCDIGASVAAAGVKKLILLNSHGGQAPVVDIVARELRIRHDMVTVAANWFALGLPEAVISPHERAHGLHAGEMETAMMLALHPEKVEMDRARHFDSLTERLERNFARLGHGRGARLGWQAQDLNPAGAVGDAARATAETGQAIVAHVAAALVELFADVHRYPVSLLHNPTEI